MKETPTHTNSLWFHYHKIYKTGKSTETEIRITGCLELEGEVWEVIRKVCEAFYWSRKKCFKAGKTIKR